jgi:hypothetical protein
LLFKEFILLKIIKIDSWVAMQQAASSMILWGFRGQADCDWKLDTTFYRLAEKNNILGSMLWHKEYHMLRQFTRRATHYCEHTPTENDLFEWLSLMQHHGSPTRLLDLSHSMFIAAFFAMENAQKDAAIWAVNLEQIRRTNMDKYGMDSYRTNIDNFNTEIIAVANEIISKDGKEKPNVDKGVILIEPEKLHERILNQQGLFLFPTDINCSISDNLGINAIDPKTVNSELSFVDSRKDYIIKFIIPFEFKREILQSLDSMNINSRTLFPGLDGFARSMQTLMLMP